jgi:arylsulfatase A-like enzyme
MDTPFKWTKQVASHFGGTRNGMIISWPARIKDKGGFRSQFSSVIDIYPTILEVVGVQSPSMLNGIPRKPIEGTSLAYTFDDAKALSTHRTQYFEMFANRAIHNDGRIACTTPPTAPWVGAQLPDVDSYKWELYKVNDDFSEPNDLAAREPKKLRELQDLFWAEAAKYITIAHITIAPRVDFKERTLKATRPYSPISDPSDRESFSPRRRR